MLPNQQEKSKAKAMQREGYQQRPRPPTPARCGWLRKHVLAPVLDDTQESLKNGKHIIALHNMFLPLNHFGARPFP